MTETHPIPDKACDLVMKGGITSGVVYPKAVRELSKHYRFECIGGTSAGAIAAVVTGAAEYGRQSGGFAKLEKVQQDLSESLKEKFQPTPALAPLFNLALAIMTRKPKQIFSALITNFARQAMLGILPGLAVLLVLVMLGEPIGGIVFGAFLMALGFLACAAYMAFRQLTRELPKHDYGLCTGLTQPDAPVPALTDWLCTVIDDVAGLERGTGPLTVSMLTAELITVRTVTTDITTRRPYSLPLSTNIHAFSEAEFRRIFPKSVVDHMVKVSDPVSADWGIKDGDLHYFKSDDLPVVVLARMSLSFPGLIAAVPLHRVDYTLVNPGTEGRVRRCLFSDGGLSSNFPLHFFDNFLPQRPTFGISLGELDPQRVQPGSEQLLGGRIHLPLKPGEGQLLPTTGFAGLIGFIMAMFNSAKDWQDSLQSILPGYRERIVTVSLKPDEGGLNLEMPRETIEFLGSLGEAAGQRIVADFNFDEHRWRRYLVELRAIEDMLLRFNQSWNAPGKGPSGLSYREIATDYMPKSYKALTETDRLALKEKADLIAALGATPNVSASSLIREKLPASHSRLRNIASMD